MRAWIIQVGEPLPGDQGARQMRSGILAERLAKRGHEVVWWASTFDHLRKRQRANRDVTVSVSSNLRVELLHSPGYQRNVSLARVLDHQLSARRFRQRADDEPAPDVILASLPTLDHAAVGVKYALSRRIPVVVDIRDLWPDILLDQVPKFLRGPARAALHPYYRAARTICEGATALTAVSESYLQWGLGFAGRGRKAADRVYPLGYASGVADEALQRSLVQKLGLGERELVALFVGTFGVTYDLSTVIEAARLLQGGQGTRTEASPIKIVLVGDGEQRSRWEVQARGLGNVVFAGWQSADAIGALLGQAEIGLLAYAANAPQSMPNKLFEYMSGGLVLVSSLPGEASRFIEAEGLGYTYAPGDSQQLATILDDLARARTRLTEVRSRSRAVYLEKYDSSRIYEDMADYLLGFAAKT
jgi:glycosyltransferase involved in cell wall biosynthesis